MSPLVVMLHTRNIPIHPGQISFSGCEDDQTSADVVKGGLAVGAMSYAFMKCLGTFLADFPLQRASEP